MPRPAKTSFKFDPATAWVDWGEVGFGVWLYTCWAKGSYAPVGLVWGITLGSDAGKSTFVVYGSFVPPWARRQGVRTFINEAILKHTDVIASSHGTKEGAAFMKAAGYTTDRDTGLYKLVRHSKKGRAK